MEITESTGDWTPETPQEQSNREAKKLWDARKFKGRNHSEHHEILEQVCGWICCKSDKYNEYSEADQGNNPETRWDETRKLHNASDKFKCMHEDKECPKGHTRCHMCIEVGLDGEDVKKLIYVDGTLLEKRVVERSL